MLTPHEKTSRSVGLVCAADDFDLRRRFERPEGVPFGGPVQLGADHDHLAELIATGIVRAPTSGSRHVPKHRIKSKGTVSDLVAEQRR